jgi:hypothetical protein
MLKETLADRAVTQVTSTAVMEIDCQLLALTSRRDSGILWCHFHWVECGVVAEAAAH